MSANNIKGEMNMGLQEQFINFNKKIKMDYDEKSELADKRDKLIKKLNRNENLPGFIKLDQGSYAMFTGVEPLDKEYDIDVGLRFNVDKADYEDPMTLKRQVQEILDGHTSSGAEIKTPCVTVTYKKDGEDAYHADLVVYVYEDKNDKDSQLYLARGKDTKPEEICWEKSDPKGLVDYINGAVEDADDREQYRRVIRYLKRWKNKKFTSSGNSEPPSIGITLIAAEKYKVYKETDTLSSRVKYNDLEALYNLATEMQNLFEYKRTNEFGREIYTIEVGFPKDLKFETDVNIFKKMTEIQMTTFKEKVDKLVDDLGMVRNETDIIEQCKKLNTIFGDDFEIPEVEDVSIKQKNCIPSSSASGVGYID